MLFSAYPWWPRARRYLPLSRLRGKANWSASALRVRDADKLTYRQQLWVYTPHTIEGVFKGAAGEILAEALAARKPDIA